MEMKKKDIYEHLAKIYLEAASTKNNKGTPKNKLNNFFLIGAIILIVGSAAALFLLRNKNLSRYAKLNVTSERALVMQSNIVKINFNFNPATKEVYAMNLNKLDMRGFRALGFSVRKSDFDDKIILKIDFANAGRQHSDYYLTNLKSYKWQDYKIDLSDFRNITDWSQMSNLSFVVEEWNTPKKNGVVYIDNIRFVE